MRIPEVLKVGGIQYTVKIVDEIHDSSNPDGRMNASNQTIEIKRRDGKEFMEVTFLHEMIHALHLHMGLFVAECPPREEEVDALANALHMVFRDNQSMMNPDLLFEEVELSDGSNRCKKICSVMIDGIRYEAVTSA